MRIDGDTLDLAAPEGARVVVRGLLTKAEEAAESLAAGKGDEPLHDFRVAVRRLRSALRTFRPWLGGVVRPRHEKRLRRLARSTNEARDAEVQLAWVTARHEQLSSPSRRPGYALAVSRLASRRDAGPAPARLGADFRRVERKLRRRLDRDGRGYGAAEGATFGVVMAALVIEQQARLAARVGAIRSADDVKAAHRARIAAKRLRYLLEPLRGVRGAEATPVIRGLERLQDLLGELHDAHVLAAGLGPILVEVAAERARGVHAALLALGAEHASLRRRLGGSPRPGLLALVRLVREERDALFAGLDDTWRGGGMEALADETRGLAVALAARGDDAGGGVHEAGRPALQS